MRHYYIVVYKSEINDRIMRIIIHTSKICIFRLFNSTPYILLSFTKISKAKAKYLGYKFDK